ncbi:MAG: extensin family protein [Actinobacteria bacterium]|nr:extensin family protein [Actinomycetota bacterium]
MAATERAYRTIGGVPLRYLRSDVRVRTYYARSTAAFEDKLDAFAHDLGRAAPPSYGAVRYIATAGAYVNKPKLHGLGRAFDLDLVRWQGRTCAPIRGHHGHARRAVIRRYIGVDALARRRFKYVLDGWYNAAHRDHLHLDDGGGALVFNAGYRSDTVFIQAAANVMINARLAVDGVYGPKTRRAFATMKDRVGIAHRVSSDARLYRAFLWRLALRALRNKGL